MFKTRLLDRFHFTKTSVCIVSISAKMGQDNMWSQRFLAKVLLLTCLVQSASSLEQPGSVLTTIDELKDELAAVQHGFCTPEQVEYDPLSGIPTQYAVPMEAGSFLQTRMKRAQRFLDLICEGVEQLEIKNDLNNLMPALNSEDDEYSDLSTLLKDMVKSTQEALSLSQRHQEEMDKLYTVTTGSSLADKDDLSEVVSESDVGSSGTAGAELTEEERLARDIRH